MIDKNILPRKRKRDRLKFTNLNDLKKALEKDIKEKGLNIEIGVTGCIGMCYLEPLVDFVRDAWNWLYYNTLCRYTKAAAEKISQQLQSFRS